GEGAVGGGGAGGGGEGGAGVGPRSRRQSLSDFTSKALAAAAGHIAEGIQHHQTRAVLRATETEFRVARGIQQQLFPRTPPAVDGFDIGGAPPPPPPTPRRHLDYIPPRDRPP